MALELLRGAAPPGPCSYLPDETASLEYRYLLDIAPAEFEAMLSRGWRRQGACFFRPGCPRCAKCRSLRVDVAAFAPGKSFRRCLKRNADVRVVFRPPSLTKDHLAVFDAYHADMHRRRGWHYDPATAEDYSRTFLAGHFSFAREFLYLRGRELIGVGLVDVTPNALSSIYFYHRPDWRPAGPGTFSVLREIDYAKETGRRWLYLGYWIPENASMAYKNRFAPHEILERYVREDETPVWRRPEEGLSQRRKDAEEE
ncbi:MAG TPA: arginyltransferase [Planctomycetaceae bacterium]